MCFTPVNYVVSERLEMLKKIIKNLKKKFKSLFYPDKYFYSVLDIDFKKIYDMGIRGLIFDIDNTIVPYNTYETPDTILNLFKELAAQGFLICFLSNNKKKRVEYFSKLFNIRGFHTALKPTVFGLWRAVKHLNLSHEKLAIIGDQIFTDVICGRSQNILTILVDPIVERDGWINKFKRKLEKKILAKKNISIDNKDR